MQLFMRGLERKDREVRKDLSFWVDFFKYVPRLPFSCAEEVEQLKGLLQELNDELVELDFSALIEYLAEI